MYRFDVTYTLDNYYEYYKYVLVRQRIIRDLVFCLLFVGIGIYFFIHNYMVLNDPASTEEQLASVNAFLPWLAIILGVLFPCMNFLTLPLLKKQLKAKQSQIDATHLDITFEEEEVVYINLNAKKDEAPVEEAKEEVVDETQKEVVDETKEEVVDEAKEEAPAEEEKKDDSVFNLKYENFMQVIETKEQFLFYLDRSTVVIIPKTTSTFGDDFAEFKEFIRSKINKKRIKFIKEKKVVEE